MTLNSSGIMSIGGTTTGASINLELGLAQNATSGLGDTNFRTLAGVATGAISMSNFYGKSNLVNMGYWPGGTNFGGAMTATIYGLNMNTEARSNPTATMANAYVWWSPLFNSTTAYISCGTDSPNYNHPTVIYTFTFSSGVRSNIAATININQDFAAGNISNQVTYGYWISSYNPGYIQPGAGRTRLQYSNNTTSYTATNLYAWGTYSEGVNSTTEGYATNGPTSGVPGAMQKFTFSTEVAASISANFSSWDGRGGANSATVGYWFGGNAGNLSLTCTNLIQAWTFSTGAAKSVSAVMPSTRCLFAAPQTSTKAYPACGATISPLASFNTIYGFLFSSEAISTLSATLSTANSQIFSFQNGGVL
jgi:hypothetical protein